MATASEAQPESSAAAERGARPTGLARLSGRIALAAFFLVALVALMFEVANNTWSIETVLQLLGYAAFAIVGAILLEQASHPIGAICLAIGLGGAIGGLGQEYLDFADRHAVVGGTEALTVLMSVVGFPATALVFTFLPLLFPDGRLPSNRWRPVAWIAAADIVALALAIGFTPVGLFSTRPNPIVLIPAGAPTDVLFAVASALTVIAGATCASALLWRYQGADSVTRQQLKWVAGAVAVFAVGLVLSILLPPLDTFAWVLPVIPIAVGIAVLRYRLYDIDVLISRALVYVPLTAMLAGGYAASVALFQRLFVTVTGQTTDAAIVITTLILAAAFTPVRKALENAVERRFRPAQPAPATSLRASATSEDPDLDARIRAIARNVVREALAERADVEGVERPKAGHGHRGAAPREHEGGPEDRPEINDRGTIRPGNRRSRA